MTISEDTDNYPIAPPPIIAATLVQRPRRPGLWRVAGTALIIWGVVGMVLLALFFNGFARPIADLNNMAASLETQRAAAVAAIDKAKSTIDQTATGVRGMDSSLSDAKAATDRASSIANDVSASMADLADKMQINIFGLQPLAGLAPGFSNAATQLSGLSTDLATIGQSLDSNRDDAQAVAQSLDELSTSLADFKTAVNSGPQLDDVARSLDSLRIGILALLAWLGALAVGSIVAGIGCFVVARGE
jgi:uncharacterized phage infection (PIP) family protein YhgE